MNRLTLILALLAFVTAAPALRAAEDVPRILVSGEGVVEAAPDMAVLSLTVAREAKTARAAVDANSGAMAEVMRALGAAGIAERDLQTTNFSIQPVYSQAPRGAGGERPAREITAYRVRNGLTVRVRDLTRLGDILDNAVSLGVNEGGSIRFTNADTATILERARTAAVADALARAATLAKAAGVEVGEVLEISEQSFPSRPIPMAARAEVSAMVASDGVPFAAGENTYRVTVNVALAIKP